MLLQGVDLEAQDGSGRGIGEEGDSEQSLEVQTEDEDAFLDIQEASYASSQRNVNRSSADTSLQQTLLEKGRD